jgi:hypothetical protein
VDFSGLAGAGPPNIDSGKVKNLKANNCKETKDAPRVEAQCKTSGFVHGNSHADG